MNIVIGDFYVRSRLTVFIRELIILLHIGWYSRRTCTQSYRSTISLLNSFENGKNVTATGVSRVVYWYDGTLLGGRRGGSRSWSSAPANDHLTTIQRHFQMSHEIALHRIDTVQINIFIFKSCILNHSINRLYTKEEVLEARKMLDSAIPGGKLRKNLQ